MLRYLLLILCLVNAVVGSGLVSAEASKPVDQLELKASDDIADALRVTSAMEALTTQVMACMEEKGDNTEQCLCRSACECPFPGEWQQLSKAYDDVVREHPEWRTKVLYYQIPGSTMSNNTAMENLGRMLSKACR